MKHKNSQLLLVTSRQEIKIMVSMFIKIALQNFFEFMPSAIANMFIGHLSNSAVLMAGCGMALSFAQASAVSIAWGFTTPLKTLIPQSIGSNKLHLLPIYVQRAFIITLFALFPLSILQIYSADIIELIYGTDYCHNETGICHVISTYCTFLIPYIWMRCWITICQRAGQNLNLNSELAISLMIGSLSCIPFNYFFVYYLNYGYIGVAITMDVINCISCLLMVLFLYLRGYGYIFKPASFSMICSFKGMREYVYLALPGFGRAITGFLSVEIVIFLSGFIITNTSIAISTSTILYGISIILIVTSEALGLVLGVRVGKYIGNGNISAAKRSIKYGAMLAAIWAIFSSITINLLFIVYGDVIIKLLWIDNDEIIALVVNLGYLLIIRNVVFCWFFPLNGICSGIGLPEYSGYGISFAQWIVAFPIQLILLFWLDYRNDVEMGLFCIWSIPAFSRATLCFILTFVLFYRLNWESIVTKSQQRLLIDHKSPSYGAIQT